MRFWTISCTPTLPRFASARAEVVRSPLAQRDLEIFAVAQLANRSSPLNPFWRQLARVDVCAELGSGTNLDNVGVCGERSPSNESQLQCAREPPR